MEARDVLAPVYDWFTEGFDALILKEATLLPRLRWEGEVRLWRTADVVPLASIV
jgi:hypothetical protein